MITRLLLLVVLTTTAPLPLFGQEIVLGVLEEVPGSYVGEANWRGVRVLFRKTGDDWHAFPSNCPDQNCLATISSQYPHEATWMIGFDGRSLARLTGRTPKDFKTYSHIGLQEISTKHSIPTLGKRSREYSGDARIAVYRPLAANSQAFFKDPESWKRSQLSTDLVSRLLHQFRQKFPKLCKLTRDQSKLEPLLYRNKDIKLVRAYTSREGWTVARLHLENAIDCNDMEAGFEIDDPWFTADPQSSVEYLGQGMWLVDAGDYDNDGKSELLFAIDRSNRGGYELFYDHFKKRATFEFSFH